MTRPLVSVVLPTRNRVGNLGRAVQSVFQQSVPDWELIIVDDASGDGTAAYLSELVSQDDRVRLVRNVTPMGGAGARNAGLKQSRGEWIAFLDDDDEWLPTKLQHQLQALNSNPAAVACSCHYVMRFPSGTSRMVTVPASVRLEQLVVDNQLGSASLCICSSEVLRDIGGFDAKLRSAQDQDLWVRLRQRGDVVVCNLALVLYQAHGGPRVTNNMGSQYAGARRFHFKHRHLMDEQLRRRRMALNCYLMSRQDTRPFRHRLQYLMLSLLNSSPGVSLSYAKSSVPRLIRDVFLHPTPPR